MGLSSLIKLGVVTQIVEQMGSFGVSATLHVVQHVIVYIDVLLLLLRYESELILGVI